MSVNSYMTHVFQGQLVGICGSVGCGKSSLLSAVLGKVSTFNNGKKVVLCDFSDAVTVNKIGKNNFENNKLAHKNENS